MPKETLTIRLSTAGINWIKLMAHDHKVSSGEFIRTILSRAATDQAFLRGVTQTIKDKQAKDF